MSARYRAPLCVAPNGPAERPCGTRMTLLGERHPAARAGWWIFQCPRCEAVRALDDQTIGRYAERIQ